MTSLLSTLTALLMPSLHTIRHYTPHKLRKDLLAGLTVAVVEAPQAMAYALIAGVPPQYGLYTSILQGVIGALLSSSEHLTTGPTNTQSLLIASTVSRLAGGNADLYLQLVFCLTLLKGLIQLAFAAARMGNMVRYVSRAVISGVAAGAGVLIIVGQLPAFLGIDIPTTTTHHLPGILGAMERLWPHLNQVNWHALLIGGASLAVALGIRKLSPLLPGALLAVLGSAAAIALCGWDQGQLPLVGDLPRAFPHFAVPALTWERAESLIGGALALALLGMLESVAIVKAIASHTGERINPNQEFFAQGFKNALTSFFQCIPGSGSFTRSALDYAAGAQTRFAAVFNSLFVAMIFWLFARQARYIPLASLAAILFIIAYGLVDYRYLARVARSSRSDLAVFCITLLASVLAPLQYAIFIGIFLNIGLYLRKATRLHLAEMVQITGGRFMERPLPDRSGGRQVVFLQMEGDLFFGVADELADRLAQLSRGSARVVIFRLKRTHSVDSTVLHVLESFAREMKAKHRHVLLCGVKSELMTVLRAYGLVDLIGRENVFETGFGVFASAKRALQRARQLVGSSIDAEGIDTEDEPEEFFYQI